MVYTIYSKFYSFIPIYFLKVFTEGFVVTCLILYNILFLKSWWFFKMVVDSIFWLSDKKKKTKSL